MQRVIKFRAWDGERKVMVSGDEIEEFTEEVDEISYTVDCPRYSDGLSYGVPFVSYTNKSGDFDTCDLMQFTGLLDKNGKEIYEGDVLKGHATGRLYPVIWKAKSSQFYASSGQFYLDAFRWGESEIIGNIYENPKPLEAPCNETK